MFLSFLCCIFSVYHFILLYYIFFKKITINYYTQLLFYCIGMWCKDCSEVVKRLHQRWENYCCSQGLGRMEEGEPSVYLSWAWVMGLSCMSEALVFNHRRDALLLFLQSPHHLPSDHPTNLLASCPTGC